MPRKLQQLLSPVNLPFNKMDSWHLVQMLQYITFEAVHQRDQIGLFFTNWATLESSIRFFENEKPPKKWWHFWLFFTEANFLHFHPNNRFQKKGMFVFKSGLMWLFWTFKLTINIDIFAFCDLPTVWATFSQNWAIFSPSSGHKAMYE